MLRERAAYCEGCRFRLQANERYEVPRTFKNGNGVGAALMRAGDIAMGQVGLMRDRRIDHARRVGLARQMAARAWSPGSGRGTSAVVGARPRAPGLITLRCC